MSNWISRSQFINGTNKIKFSWVLILCGILFPTSIQAQTICGDREIKTDLSQLPDYHYYRHATLICVKSFLPGCTKEFVFNTMISNINFVAPIVSDIQLNPTEQSVSDCRLTTLEVGNIITTVDINSLTVVNYTVPPVNIPMKVLGKDHSVTIPEHALYPGKVRRSIIEAGDGIYVETVGEGAGVFPRMNEFFGDTAFTLLDLSLKSAVGEKLCEEIGRAHV